MMHKILLTVTMLFVAGFANSELPNPAISPPSVTDSTLARFVGVWDMQLMTHAETFGERGGPGEGTMICEWGPMKAWVDCDMDSVYESFGRYTLTIVLHRLAKDGAIGAFVTNSFGGGRLYIGHWENDTDLVFRDAWIDPAKKWEHQVTTYTFPNDATIDYRIDVSKDNKSYLPHSSGRYDRQLNNEVSQQ